MSEERTHIDMEVALDPEKYTMTLVLHNIPLDRLEGVLLNMAKPSWRQNILDGVRGAVAAKDLGIASTERTFRVAPEEAWFSRCGVVS